MDNKERYKPSEEEIIDNIIVTVIGEVFRSNLHIISDNNRLYDNYLRNLTDKLYNQLDRKIDKLYDNSDRMDELIEFKKLLTEGFKETIEKLRTELLTIVQDE